MHEVEMKIIVTLFSISLLFLYSCDDITSSNDVDFNSVSYYYIATVAESWSYFKVGDTISGILSFDDSSLKNNEDTLTIKQDAPVANLIMHYKQLSTGKIATGRVNDEENNAHDLIGHVYSNYSYLRYTNIEMDKNDMFVDSGIDYGYANFRFAKPYTSEINDIMELEPTYLTMTIHH